MAYFFEDIPGIIRPFLELLILIMIFLTKARTTSGDGMVEVVRLRFLNCIKVLAGAAFLYLPIRIAYLYIPLLRLSESVKRLGEIPSIPLVYYLIVLSETYTILLFFLFYLWIMRPYGLTLSSFTQPYQTMRHLKMGSLVGILLVSIGILAFLTLNEEQVPSYIAKRAPQGLLLVRGMPMLFLLHLIVTGLIAPLIEEMLYRGYLYPLLKTVYKTRWAMLLSVVVWPSDILSTILKKSSLFPFLGLSWSYFMRKPSLSSLDLLPMYC